MDHVIGEAVAALREDALGDARSALQSVAGRLRLDDPREYELAATRLATEAPNMADRASRLALDQSLPQEERLLATVVAAIAFRRSRLRSRGQFFLESVGGTLPATPLLTHMRALAHAGGDPEQLRTGRDLARRARSEMPDNPGVAHSLATFIADLAYCDDDSCDDDELHAALRLVDDALLTEQRPRYYYTKGRIHRRLGNYEEARAALTTAIVLEDRAALDYRERLTDYVVEMSLVDADRTIAKLISQSREALEQSQSAVDEVDRRLEAALERFRDAQYRTVETIAFFASALALIQFSAVALGNEMPFWQSLSIIAVLGLVLFAAVLVGAYALRRVTR